MGNLYVDRILEIYDNGIDRVVDYGGIALDVISEGFFDIPENMLEEKRENLRDN